MLNKEELRGYEKVVGLNLWQVEKDYLQHLLLLFLYQRIKTELIFKGGTALQKVFGLNRFSIDLDFTSTDNKAEKVLEDVTKDMTTFGFPSNVSKVEKMEVGKIIVVKIKGPLYEGTERTITTLRMEISSRKDLVLGPVEKEIVPVYPDLRAYRVVVMSLEEILAEKVRAILWRARARDLYDLWFLLKKNVKLNLELINKKLTYYDLKFDKNQLFKQIESLKGKWELELPPTVKVLPSFETTREDCENFLKEI
ncbi:MAG: nucleotidyl transferase AbiEii/AbiGii toxin family protein [Candidatus Aenigmarchaeota archaeon]|nr:nucleotidyl transferase AbiEii/AbiGii toxin family protein [Candidatus Aenigmarchaeota archaeon]